MHHATQIIAAVHGGAGTILPENLTAETADACHAALADALKAAFNAFVDGADALTIAVTAALVLEDCPLFNAGRGAVYTADGRHELDAAVMEGTQARAGAVTGVTRVKNPIRLALAVLERSPFVFLSGTGADDFAREQGIEEAPDAYFHTDERWRQLLVQRQHGAVSLSEDNKFGTIGAVARDRHNRLAAATSTGGMTGKRFGRIGDSPVIGAGTWADDATCAVSATGHGEYFIRAAAAHAIHARMAFAHHSIGDAARAVVLDHLARLGGDGGVIALDRNGDAALPCNCPGMYRGVVTLSGEVSTAIYRDEAWRSPR
jgi:beta-aspartyl-peptidase (threonine type)